MNAVIIPICVWTLAILGGATPMITMLELDKSRRRSIIENALSTRANHAAPETATPIEFPEKRGAVL